VEAVTLLLAPPLHDDANKVLDLQVVDEDREILAALLPTLPPLPTVGLEIVILQVLGHSLAV